LRKAEFYNKDKHDWIRDLQAAGLQYEIEILEELANGDEIGTAETEWIVEALRCGAHLLNKTQGGDGGQLGRRWKWTEESRRKMAEQRSGCGNPNWGRPRSAEMKRKSGESQLGKVVSPESRAKLSAALMGRKLSAETRAKMSASRKGVPRGPRTIGGSV